MYQQNTFGYLVAPSWSFNNEQLVEEACAMETSSGWTISEGAQTNSLTSI